MRDPSLVWEFYNYRREVRCFCLTEGDHPALIPVPHWLSYTLSWLCSLCRNADPTLHT